MKAKLKTYISNNKVEKTFDMLLSMPVVIEEKEIFNEVIIQRARFERYQSEIRKGIINTESADIKYSRIVTSIVELIEDIPERELDNGKIEKSRAIELVLDEKIEDFNSEKKDELLKVLSEKVNVPIEEVRIKRIKQKNNKLALTLESSAITSLVDIVNSNTPQIEVLKSNLNIIGTKRIKDVTIWGIKKSIPIIKGTIIFFLVIISLLCISVFYLIKYTGLLDSAQGIFN